jgi:DNA-binding IclR family transcriptional regulator
MVRDPLSGDDQPDLQSVLDALDDADCRTIIRHLDEPMTATEVSEECDIPMSTTYRKLDLLTDASLLVEGTEIRPDGHHATRYELDFETVSIGLTEAHDLEVSIDRPARTADERLASLWGEVRKET